MKEMFDKLDNYESRFSTSVWAGVNQHLEQERAKKKRTRILLFASAVALLGMLTIGYLSIEEPNQLASQPADHHQLLLDQVGATAITAEILSVSETIVDSDITVEESVNDLGESTLSVVQATEEDINIDKVLLGHSISSNSKSPELRKTIVDNHFTSEKGYVALASVSQATDLMVESERRQIVFADTPRPRITDISSLPTTESRDGKSTLRSLFVKEGCDLLGAKPFKSYVWSQLSTFTPVSQLSAKLSEDSNYANARELSESTLPSVEIGIGLGIKTKSGIFAEAGLQYAVWRERFGYVDPESIGYQTVITIDTMFVNGEITIDSDTSSIQINGSTEIVNFNSHRTVSVPLLIGYEKRIASQFSIAMRAGAILNISTTSEGRILDRQMSVIDINQNDSTNSMVYNTKLSTQLMAGGQLVYHFSPALDVYINPEIRVTPKSNTTEAYSLNQRFVSPTIGAGLRYYF